MTRASTTDRRIIPFLLVLLFFAGDQSGQALEQLERGEKEDGPAVSGGAAGRGAGLRGRRAYRCPRFCESTFSADMLRFYRRSEEALPEVHAQRFERVRRPVDPTRASAWRIDLAAREVADVESAAREQMKELGYVPHQPPSGGQRRSTLAAFDRCHLAAKTVGGTIARKIRVLLDR